MSYLVWILFATEARHTDHRGWPSYWGQSEPADSGTKGSSVGPRCGLHGWDGALWPGTNPRKSCACKGGRWVLGSNQSVLLIVLLLFLLYQVDKWSELIETMLSWLLRVTRPTTPKTCYKIFLFSFLIYIFFNRNKEHIEVIVVCGLVPINANLRKLFRSGLKTLDRLWANHGCVAFS